MRFTKMHGNGNDYIYAECFTQHVNPEDAPRIARGAADRHKGVGSDGLVLIRPSDIADCRMDMYNADGSMGMMCGNAIRCIGKFMHDKGINTNRTITVETLKGIKTLELSVSDGVCISVRAHMGKADFSPRAIPMNHATEFINKPITAGGSEFFGTCVNTGSSHIVIYVESPAAFDAAGYGAIIENHGLFPDRINVNFARVVSRTRVESRTWERGSGETMACGSGACACAVVSAKLGLTEKSVTVSQRGGELDIEIDENGGIFMTGSAAFVCDGVLHDSVFA